MTEGCFFLNRCTIPRYKVENRICQRYFWLVKQQLEHRSHWFTPQWECALTEKYAHEGAQSKQNDETIFPTLDGRHSPEINVDVQESINVIFRQRTPPLLSEGTNGSMIYPARSMKMKVVCFERTAPPKMRGWGRCGFWGLLDYWNFYWRVTLLLMTIYGD